MKPRICLIVDNPLRDLDGIVLLAREISRLGGEPYVVPMYTQGFDVTAIAPQVVLTNYVRRNNIDLLKLYANMGIAVAVLDTEGAVGKSADDNALLVKSAQCDQFVDAYCFWGEAQVAAFRRVGAIPESMIRLTGCPRYDFCSERWRGALGAPGVPAGYVLINTNFPIVHPRYSSGTAEELAIWDRTGVDPVWSRQYARDAQHAHAQVLDTASRLSARFPDQRFVIRPHPFERISGYDAAAQLPNFEVHQEGTSLKWINGAALLVHQNCSTAIEAAMLGVEPVSLEWFNTEALRVPAPCDVSHAAIDFDDLARSLERCFSGETLLPVAAQLRAREEIVRRQYYRNDGDSASRVAQVAMDLAVKPRRRGLTKQTLGSRARLVHGMRRLLGYAGFEEIRKRRTNTEVENRRQAKYFSRMEVEEILQRLSRMDGVRYLAMEVRPDEVSLGRMCSGNAYRIIPSH